MKGLIITLFIIPLLAFPQANTFQKKIEDLLKKGNIKEAMEIAQGALKINPTDPSVLHGLSKIHFKNRNFKVAEVFLAQAIERSKIPTDEMHFDMGQTLQMSHQFQEALEEYDKVSNRFGLSNSVKSLIAQCKSGIELVAKPLEVKISNLGKAINTPDHEFHPLVTADEIHMIFTRSQAEEFNPFNPKFCQINQSFSKGGWEKSNPVPKPIQSTDGEIAVNLSSEGNQLGLLKNVKSEDLFISNYIDGTWSKLKSLPINSPKMETSFCYSPDGSRMYFVSNRKGNKDIFQCKKMPGGQWGKAILVDSKINTSEDEECPWIDPEGNFLYFSSKGHNSMGGFDIFKLDLKKQGALPENIGYPINSTSDDLFFQTTPDGKSAYYSSVREGGYGGSDIYHVQMAGIKTKQVIFFKGIITDLGGLPIDAQIVISEVSTRTVVAKIKAHPETGTFITRLQNGKSYSILVEKEGYLFHSDFIDLEDENSISDVNREIAMQKLQPGVSLILSNVYFDLGKSSLKKESSQELQRILMIMRQNPGLVAEISSHLEPGGPEEDGHLKLSDYRAQAIVDYLVATGIKSTRLVAKGYGSTKPLTENEAKKGLQNRRCEFKIISIQ